ncbi:random slug protein 5-like [Vigna radiata var. radiata]|uniref:Random slug protein 5-like n=1 Tax=Vigna radiata var. radiata TaxID=3916 RepID=A0A1S3TZU1_VIGRR|nr:random slug protein 5-like [Vigna radiata var. radiata]
MDLRCVSEDKKKTASTGHDEMVVSQEQQAKITITEVRELIGQLSDKESVYCSDASISSYLMSRNSNVKKAAQMLKQSMKWRKKFKPEEIRWMYVAADEESGSIYQDKYGRTVIVSTPRRMNSKSTERHRLIKHFVHCLENAILNLPPHQEQLVWLIDLNGIKMSDIASL